MNHGGIIQSIPHKQLFYWWQIIRIPKRSHYSQARVRYHQMNGCVNTFLPSSGIPCKNCKQRAWKRSYPISLVVFRTACAVLHSDLNYTNGVHVVGWKDSETCYVSLDWPQRNSLLSPQMYAGCFACAFTALWNFPMNRCLELLRKVTPSGC